MKRINALGRRLMAMVFAMGLSLVAFADPATWFVDPANGVDDVAHDGTTWEKAKQSLVEVMKLAQSGDTVKAAVGVYETGYANVTISSHDARFRVSIPAGVTLVATGACERTIIKGADATTPLYHKGGCGIDSVACVYLAGTGATVQGFTIGVKVTRREPYNYIELQDDGAPFKFMVSLHFDPADDPLKCDFHIDLLADLNLMMKMMIGNRIQEGLDKIVDGLTEI